MNDIKKLVKTAKIIKPGAFVLLTFWKKPRTCLESGSLGSLRHLLYVTIFKNIYENKEFIKK